ncbi:Heat shock protein 60, partial [Colletotrichum gloeosporioides]
MWLSFTFLHHSTHAAHAAHTSHTAHTTGGRALLLRSLNDGDLSGAEQGGNTAGVNETGADDLEGVEDTGSNHVDVLALGAVEALVELVGELVGELTNDDRALKTGVLDDAAGGAGDGVLDDADTELLVEVGGLDVLQGQGRGLDEGGTTTGQDTLLNGGAGGVQGIDEAVLLLTDLDLGGATDLDDGDTTRELGQTLLKLLLLVLGGGRVVHDTTDLLAALSNGVLATLAVQEDGVLLGNGDGASGAEHVGGGLLELDVKLVGEDRAVVTEDGLAVVTEAGGLDSGNLELATELVENADGESLTLNVLSNDDERAAHLGGGLKSGDDILDGGDLLLGEEDQGLLELDLLGLGIGDEVGGDETTVEAHTLGDLELVDQSLALLDGDDTLLADLLHGVGNHAAESLVTVGRDSGDLSNLLAGSDISLVLLEVLDDGIDGGLDTTAQVHRVAASGDVLDGLGEDGAGEDSSGRGTVTGGLVGLGGDILEESGTEVLELVLQGDGLGDSYTNVTTLGTKCRGNGLGQSLNTSQQRSAALDTELELLQGESVYLVQYHWHYYEAYKRTLWAKRSCWPRPAPGRNLVAAEEAMDALARD